MWPTASSPSTRGSRSDFHDAVADELAVSMNEGSPLLGDNLLPRIPMLGDLLDSPAVDGAMTSLLGEDYAWAPHRFPHNSEPLAAANRSHDFDPFQNNARMGPGSISGSGWHQDGHSKAGRSRWHTFRAANLFYFPQDTPLAKGPTRLLAGSHLYANINTWQRPIRSCCATSRRAPRSSPISMSATPARRTEPTPPATC